MDFNDRLRNQLRTQSNDLQLSPEGSDAVRSRSKRRKQRRAGGTVVATLLVALVAGSWIAGRSSDAEANLATEGQAEASDTAGSTGSGTSAPSSSDTKAPIDIALPEPGAALSLSPASDDGAPGGYNVFQSGSTNGLYYVLSTAPGVTYDDYDESVGFFRNDTIYTFDGSNWSQNSAGDRFVSTLDSNESGLLYTVSTGTAAGQALELGRSANAGQDWTWTELDLTSVFGQDRSAWPPYAVQFATRGNETFVLVHTNGQIDWEEATDIAVANGANIDPRTNDVINIDQTGITWIEGFEQNPCEAALNDALQTAWIDEPEGPEFDFDRELTDAEQAELEAYWVAQELRGQEIYADALQSVARVPGCAGFVKCSTELDALSSEFDDEIQDYYADNGDIDQRFVAEENVELDALHEAHDATVRAWARTSGCGEELPYLDAEGEGLSDAQPPSYASWESLGVTPPESWNAVNAGFIIDGEQVTNLGRIFDGENGFLIDVRSTGGQWSAIFDSTNYALDVPSESTYTMWTSTAGDDWTSEPTNSFRFGRPAGLADGTTFSPNWAEESSQLLRGNPDGTTSALTLSDLAPDLDTTGYQLMNVRAGDYGAVAWAVKWQDTNGNGQPYDSIVLYSPDGVGWGATDVPDVEVVDVIVGDQEVVLFLNDPDRDEGAAQPIMLGRA